MDRRGRMLVTVAVVGALTAPVVVDADGFPLSTYPMYSRLRASEVTFATAHGVGADGIPRTLSLDVIGASDDPLIVAGELRRAIGRGDAAARCGEIAERAARVGADDLIAIEVVSERHDVVELATGAARPIERTVHARCEVTP